MGAAPLLLLYHYTMVGCLHLSLGEHIRVNRHEDPSIIRLLRKPISSQLAQWSLVCEYLCEENTTEADFDAEALTAKRWQYDSNYLLLPCSQESRSRDHSNSLYLLSLNCKANMKKFILAAACLFALGTNISAQNPEKKEPVKKECSKNDAKSCDKKDAKTCDKKDAKTCDKKDGKACDQKADKSAQEAGKEGLLQEGRQG